MSTPTTSPGSGPVPCNQTGCPGHFVDGYCDFCGFPAPEGVGGSSGYYTATAASTAAEEEAAKQAAKQAASQGYSGSYATSHTAGQGQERRQPQGQSHGGTGATGTASTAPSGFVMPDERSAVVTLGSARGGTARRRVRPTRPRTTGLGGGLTRVPTAPLVDPREAVMSDPVVPEPKRTCAECGAEVGRGHDGEPGRTEGYCPQCRQPFSFTPKLRKGDLVAGQYEIEGPLAHGGLGWIYLAQDRNVSNRWVVLKGLLNAGDADAVAAAEAEQEFLARVEHPQIVEVYNVVTHDGAGYTVMEYVPGVSLKEILKTRLIEAGGVYTPLPVEHALAYVLGILPAFRYLHEAGMLYCDFKPDNLIQVGDQVKLIDLGGMRAIDDLDSPIYGTVGYQAPEVAEVGPSIASDIYTIGRTLVVLTAEFRGYQSTYATSLPPSGNLPAFRDNDPFYRLVAKACAQDPADRFQSIDEFRTQLLGVLRITVFDRDGAGRAAQAAASPWFDSPLVTGESLGWWELPALRADDTDPMIGWLSGVQSTDPYERLSALRSAPQRTSEIMLAEGREHLRLGDHDAVAASVDELLAADPWDWRAVWLHALDATDRDDLDTAVNSFAGVYAQVPGEMAPHLGLALVLELQGHLEAAESEYLTCLRCDAGYATAAAFGVARVRAKRGEVGPAIKALDLVPRSSAAHNRALWLKAELSLHKPGLQPLDAALRAVADLPVPAADKARFRVTAFTAALDRIGEDSEAPRVRVDGVKATDRAVRLALEEAYRRLAALTPDSKARAALVEKANEVRPWTLT